MTLEHWIEYPLEPRELLLAWEAPLSVEDRARWVVGRLSKDGGDITFDYLAGEAFAALNLGRPRSALEAAGFPGYPAFEGKEHPQGTFRGQVLKTFLRRLPSPRRPDFARYLAHHHVKPSTVLSPLALLAVTGARLPGDDFSLVDPLDPEQCRADLVFEVAGVRHHGQHAGMVRMEDLLTLEPEPSNPRDPRAVQVKTGGEVIGYVNRLQAETIGEWLKQRMVTCRVIRLNGSADARRIYAFLQVRPRRSIAAQNHEMENTQV